MCSSKDVAQGLTLMSNKKQYDKKMVVNLESTHDPRKKTTLMG